MTKTTNETMTNERALSILRRYNAWRRYGGPIGEGPDCPSSKEIGQAIDIAIRELERTKHKQPDKEYYGG